MLQLPAGVQVCDHRLADPVGRSENVTWIFEVSQANFGNLKNPSYIFPTECMLGGAVVGNVDSGHM